MNNSVKDRESERGSGTVKFIAVLAVVLLVAHAGYNYVPVAYDAESMKSEMNAAVLQGLALPGRLSPTDNVKARLQRAFTLNNVPADALMEVKQNGNSLTARVAYSKQIDMLPFGMYRYNFIFDHTATPTGFLLKQ